MWYCLLRIELRVVCVYRGFRFVAASVVPLGTTCSGDRRRLCRRNVTIEGRGGCGESCRGCSLL